MKQFFKTRNGWKIEIEKKLSEQKIKLQKHWKEMFEQKIISEKESVRIEKNAEITLLNEEIQTLKTELREYKKDVLSYDLKVAKLKNELKEKINVLDSKIKQWTGVPQMILTQIGISESLNDESEKILDKSEL